MRYISFSIGRRSSYGIAHDGNIHDLGARLGSLLPDLRSYLEAQALGFTPPAHSLEADYRHADVALLPVIPNPRKILCVGVNYEEHRTETGRNKSDFPVLFTRFADTLLGDGAPIQRPAISTALDFEAELAVIIGSPVFHVPAADAMRHIAGYTCFNDATLRDWQRHTHQFTPGKNFPATGPLGPELVTPGEVGELPDLRIEGRLNGTPMQSAKLGEMIFSIAQMIAYASTFTRLLPGDIIATGTPGGVGSRREPPIWMKTGDVFEVEIEKVGVLRNPVVDAER